MKHCLLLTVCLLLSIALRAQSASKGTLSIYPNPVTDFIALSENADPSVAYLAVYNLVGKKVKDFEYVRGDHYSVNDLPKGMYLVQIQDRQRRTLSTQKIEKRP